jgi:hypothetical protein
MGVSIGNGMAQAPAIDVRVWMDNDVYILGSDPIEMTIELENVGTDRIIASEGFSKKIFYLFFVFTGPDGETTISDARMIGEDAGGNPPPPPLIFKDGEPLQAEPVEILLGKTAPPAFKKSADIYNAYSYYALTKAGKYSVKAVIPIRTYTDISQTIDGVDFAELTSVLFQGVIESNTVDFSLNVSGVVDGDIIVHADKHTVGTGSHPGSIKESIVGLEVKAFDKAAGSCVSNYGVSWQNYGFIWDGCTPPSPEASGFTNGDGNVILKVPPGDYIVIGEYDPDGPIGPDEPIYIGVSAGGVVPEESTNKYLQVIVKADGKKGPAKYTKKTGSDLLIIEPEYVEWDGTEELYPFVFDSLGDWTVTTSVSPPEGFVADYSNLTEEVNTELKALQFTITDIGSKWVDTECTHEIKHKGKKEKIRSKIGVKLSRKLAKAKGLDRFGKEKKEK